ncbi:hypothetical protein BN871_EX_00220 [Paenibacillus sp. P22]|nr:hypothetical protein BN871_EX_00220 [Paenibacillus sp. P22]
MGSAPALDEIERSVHLVGAVDRQVERLKLGQLAERNAELAGELVRRFGGRHADDFQALFLDASSELQNRVVDGRAGAEPDLHAAVYFPGRFFPGRLLVVHDPASHGWMPSMRHRSHIRWLTSTALPDAAAACSAPSSAAPEGAAGETLALFSAQ